MPKCLKGLVPSCLNLLAGDNYLLIFIFFLNLPISDFSPYILSSPLRLQRLECQLKSPSTDTQSMKG